MGHALTVLSIALIVITAGCAGVPVDSGEFDDLVPDDSGADDGGDDVRDTPGEDTEPPDAVEGELELHHIDVGQGDATLIVTPAGETVLIDSGDWRPDGERVIDYLESEGIDRIDHLVATHAHADHIGGHAAVIEWAETEGEGIGAAYDSGVPSESATYGRYLDAVEEYDVELLIVEEGDSIPIDGEVSAIALGPPEGDSGSDLNGNSLVLAFEFGDFRYLTTGDVESDEEARILDRWSEELDADVYQVGHHGSKTSSSEPFMDAVGPEAAIISSGYDSSYGHPHDEVLEMLDARGIETYWTGVHGDVVVRTDGTDIAYETSREFSTDAGDLLAEKPADTSNALEAGAIQPSGGPMGVVT